MERYEFVPSNIKINIININDIIKINNKFPNKLHKLCII